MAGTRGWESRAGYLLVCCNLILLSLASSRAQAPNLLQPWKSFQQEIKTLEEAAHRVNTLLSNAVESQPMSEKKDVDEKPEENKLDVTVFTNPDAVKNGALTKLEGSNVKEDGKKEEKEDKIAISSEVRPSRPSHLNLGSLLSSFGFFKSLPEPWWKGDNVCIEQTEKEEKPKQEEVGDQHVFIKGTGSFEHCKQTRGKYICTTVMNTAKSTKTVSLTYQCCEGFRRQGNSCVQGEEISTQQLPGNSYSREHVSHKHTVEMNGRGGDDGSYSSQSQEAKGLPRWLHSYWLLG